VYGGGDGAGGCRRVRGQDLSPPPSSYRGRVFRQDRLLIEPTREPGLRGDIMSELPDRPDLDQLRRQAKELLRAAADGEPRARARLRAVSERVTLSAAQLAIAREHGFASWPALRAEAERRRFRSQRACCPLACWSSDPVMPPWTLRSCPQQRLSTSSPGRAGRECPACGLFPPCSAAARRTSKRSASTTSSSPTTGKSHTRCPSSQGISRLPGREKSAGRSGCA